MCKLLKNPDKGKNPVFDQFEEWKEKNSIKIKKIFRALLFKMPDDEEEDSDGYNLCEDHFAVLGIDYTPGATVPFQINFCEAIPDAFFGVDMSATRDVYENGKCLVEMANKLNTLAEASPINNKDHALKKYIGSNTSFNTMQPTAMFMRAKAMVDVEELKEQTDQECEPILGMIVVNVSPIHGQGIVKGMPEMCSTKMLMEDTETTDRHMLQALLNAGHGDLNHSMLTYKM